MEQLQTMTPLDPEDRRRSNVDTSRPFRSVKEAVAIFGKHFLAGEIYSPKTFAFPKQETPFFAPTTPELTHEPPPPLNSSPQLEDTVKKLEAELEETRAELRMLKERESETEVAVASLNAELHRNMSKLASAEAAAAAKASVGRGVSLWQVLSVEEEKMGLVVGKKERRERREMRKKKPIMPLVSEFFRKKKELAKSSSTALHNPLYASSNYLL